MAERTKTARVSHNYVAVPKSSVRRRQCARRRSRGFSTEGVLLTVGAGAIVALLANLDDLKDSKASKEHWWLIPVAVIGIGYFLRKKGNAYGGIMMAVGGALFALAYAAYQKAATQQKQQQQQQNAAPPPPPKQAKQGETGAIDPMGMSPLLIPAGGGYGWVKLPDGNLLRVPLLSRSPQLPFGMPGPLRTAMAPNNSLGVN